MKGDLEKLMLYGAALKAVWKDEPNLETQGRLRIFARWNNHQRMKFINWIEANAGKIEWCGKVQAMVVACKLGAVE